MDTAAILIKIFGLGLFGFTAYSVYKHVRAKMTGDGKAAAAAKAKSANGEHSKVEHALNVVLLYAWFTFMAALSLGMIFNN